VRQFLGFHDLPPLDDPVHRCAAEDLGVHGEVSFAGRETDRALSVEVTITGALKDVLVG
jgi:hypothetical protein